MPHRCAPRLDQARTGSEVRDRIARGLLPRNARVAEHNGVALGFIAPQAVRIDQR